MVILWNILVSFTARGNNRKDIFKVDQIISLKYPRFTSGFKDNGNKK